MGASRNGYGSPSWYDGRSTTRHDGYATWHGGPRWSSRSSTRHAWSTSTRRDERRSSWPTFLNDELSTLYSQTVALCVIAVIHLWKRIHSLKFPKKKKKKKKKKK